LPSYFPFNVAFRSGSVASVIRSRLPQTPCGCRFQSTYDWRRGMVRGIIPPCRAFSARPKIPPSSCCPVPRTRSVYCVLALRVPCVIPAVATIYTPAYAHSVLVPGPSVLYVRGIVRLRRAAPSPVRPRFFYTRVPDSVSFCTRGGAHGGRRRPPARWDCAGALARGVGARNFRAGTPPGGVWSHSSSLQNFF